MPGCQAAQTTQVQQQTAVHAAATCKTPSQSIYATQTSNVVGAILYCSALVHPDMLFAATVNTSTRFVLSGGHLACVVPCMITSAVCNRWLCHATNFMQGCKLPMLLTLRDLLQQILTHIAHGLVTTLCIQCTCRLRTQFAQHPDLWYTALNHLREPHKQLLLPHI